MVRDREAWHAAVHGVVKSQTWLSEWTTIVDTEKNYILVFCFLRFYSDYTHISGLNNIYMCIYKHTLFDEKEDQPRIPLFDIFLFNLE